jgi:integrase
MNKPSDLPPSATSPARRTTKKTSAAEKVVQQARARTAATGAVPELPGGRLEYGQDANGNPTLTAIFPGKGGDPDKHDLSFLHEFRALMTPFASGFLAWGISASPRTRQVRKETIRRFWFGYLANKKFYHLTLDDIDEQILAEFSAWLYGPISKSSGGKHIGKPLGKKTIANALGALRSITFHAPGGRFISERVHAGPRGATRDQTPIEVLNFADLIAIWSAVEKDILTIAARWKKGRELLAKGWEGLAAGQSLVETIGYNKKAPFRSYENLALCLAMLDTLYPGLLPNKKSLQVRNDLLGRTVVNGFGIGHVSGYFYPSNRDLVPFVLYIGLATVFNTETNLKLEWKNVDRTVDRLGSAAIHFDVTDEDDTGEDSVGDDVSDALVKIIGDKPRAQTNRRQVRLLDPQAADPSQPSLNLVLDLLHEMTVRIRPFADACDVDRLYLYVPRRRNSVPVSFCRTEGQRALREFVADYQLPTFTLSMLRKTLLDFAQLMNRGDLEKARQLGNHSNAITTWTHYTSDLVKKLLKETTGETMLLRERWIDTKGTIDPRGAGEDADKGCATPGFGCQDPYGSPRKAQQKERLCRAYGECPSCPLAKVRPFNPDDVRYWEALEQAMYRSVRNMTAEMWTAKWAPVLADLKNLLALVPAQVLVESRRIRLNLPDVG